jgi:prolyl-tRNA synthetase
MPGTKPAPKKAPIIQKLAHKTTEPPKAPAKKDEAAKRGITVKKAENFSEWYSQVCSEQGAQLCDLRYDVQGFIVHRPWAMRMLRKIYHWFEEQVERDGHEPYLFPAVIPEQNLLEEKEHAGFMPDVFWVTHAGTEELERRVALRPTGETQIYPMYGLWIRSYQDLPWKGYQSRITTFRNEKQTRPFLRGREFMFFETHDVFRTHDDAMGQIRKDMGMMDAVVWKRLKVPFVFFRRPQWDKFKGADDTYASDTLLPDGRRCQISSTHDLGHNFAKAFNVFFKDEDGKDKPGVQTCFGPGIWRIFASVVAVHGDDQGLVLPFDLAPVQVVIVPITFAGKEADAARVLAKGQELERKLRELGLSVKLDDSPQTPGFKFNQWELQGVPLRIELGPREVDAGEFTIARRTDRKKTKVREADLARAVMAEAEAVNAEIERRASMYFLGNTKDAATFAELKEIVQSHRGFVRVPFCSMQKDGEVCAEKIKAETTAVACGIPLEKPEKPVKGVGCIACGKPATLVMWVAKTV